MSYDVLSIPLFDKQAKRLSKKYSSLREDLLKFSENLIDDPQQGKPLGNGFYKVRLAISSKQKGKSGGARIITCVKVTKTTVYLASIYDKSEKNTITDKELEHIFGLIP